MAPFDPPFRWRTVVGCNLPTGSPTRGTTCNTARAALKFVSPPVMLQEAHKALEAMSAACTSMKDEEWGEAERALHNVQDTVARLLREVGDKMHEAIQAPPPGKGDRG